MNKVTVLEKTNGTWSAAEVNALVRGVVEVEGLPIKPSRLVVMSKPRDGKTFKELLGHSDFTEREVDYQSRWA